MDFKQLLTFREVINTGSVSEAARKLGRTQPAVSHLLSKLESEIGMQLFERRNGRLYPAPESDFLYTQASRILNELEEIDATMQRMKDVQEGNLRVVSMPGPAVEFVPSLISKYLAGKKDVRVTLLSRSSEAVHRLVEAQQFDIGLADHMPKHSIGPTAKRRTFNFSSVCAVPASHPLSRKSKIVLEDLSGEPLATLFPEHSTTRDLRVKFESASLEFVPRFEGQFFIHLLPYVADGHACAIVDPIAKASWLRSRKNVDAIRFVPVAPTLRFSVDLITPKNQVQSRLSEFFEARLIEALEALE